MEVCGYGKWTQYTKWVIQTLLMMCELTDADLTTTDADGNSLLSCAIKTGNVHLVRTLCSKVKGGHDAVIRQNYHNETVQHQLENWKRKHPRLAEDMQKAVFGQLGAKRQKTRP
jgi:hypothetical protein